MSTDAGPSPPAGPPPDPTAAPGRTAPPPDPGPPTSIHAPRFPIRDPNDPLYPEHLRLDRLSAERALLALRELKRLARNPVGDPAYARIMADIRGHAIEEQDLNTIAANTYQSVLNYRDRLALLPDSKGLSLEDRLKVLGLLRDADRDVGMAWSTWRSVFATYATLVEALGEKLPRGTPRPPANPPTG